MAAVLLGAKATKRRNIVCDKNPETKIDTFMTNVPIIEKQFKWFAEQNRLVSVW